MQVVDILVYRSLHVRCQEHSGIYVNQLGDHSNGPFRYPRIFPSSAAHTATRTNQYRSWCSLASYPRSRPHVLDPASDLPSRVRENKEPDDRVADEKGGRSPMPVDKYFILQYHCEHERAAESIPRRVRLELAFVRKCAPVDTLTLERLVKMQVCITIPK